MRTSPAGKNLIITSEGFSAVPYDDNGHTAWGYGHDQQPGEPIPESVSESEAETTLAVDLKPLEAFLSADYPSLTQNQFDACVDFGYNLGMGALRQMLEHGLDQVPTQMVRWSHVDGTVNAGLLARRQAEVALFTS